MSTRESNSGVVAPVEMRFRDSKAELRTIGVEFTDYGWRTTLDGVSVPLGAFRDILAMLQALLP